MEHIQGIHLLACTYELDRLIHDRTDRERRTTTGITIQLGQYHTVEIQTLVELTRRIHRILTRHRIHHEEGLFRLDSRLDRSDLLHHLLIYRQTTRRIDNHHVIALGFGMLNRMLRDLYRVLAL